MPKKIKLRKYKPEWLTTYQWAWVFIIGREAPYFQDQDAFTNKALENFKMETKLERELSYFRSHIFVLTLSFLVIRVSDCNYHMQTVHVKRYLSVEYVKMYV